MLNVEKVVNPPIKPVVRPMRRRSASQDIFRRHARFARNRLRIPHGAKLPISRGLISINLALKHLDDQSNLTVKYRKIARQPESVFPGRFIRYMRQAAVSSPAQNRSVIPDGSGSNVASRHPRRHQAPRGDARPVPVTFQEKR